MYMMIEEKITAALPGAIVQVLDPRDDGVHLEAIVVSEAFKGLTLVQKHRMVMDALSELFETGLHALALKTYTPEEWNAQKN